MDWTGHERRGRVRPLLNVTPLVDVVLVLLIIFMVVTPLMIKRIHLHLPPQQEQASEPPPDEETQLLLRLDEAGQLWLNGGSITARELPDRLRRIFAAREQDILFFDAADEATYQQAVEVLDLARGAGAVTIGLLTEPVAHP